MRKSYAIKLFKDLGEHRKETYLISGFHGFGAVGFLATRYLVSKLGMELIGYIEPPVIPDFTSVEDYGLSMPHEVFYRDLEGGKRIVVLLNRINPERRFMTTFVGRVLDLVKKLGIAEVLLVGGLDSRFKEGEEEFRWLKTSACSRELDAPYFMKGAYVVGPLASLLIAFQQSGVPAMVVLPYTQPEAVDHRAAAVAVRVLSTLVGVDIDVNELLSYASKVEEIEKMIQDLYEQQYGKRESVMHT